MGRGFNLWMAVLVAITISACATTGDAPVADARPAWIDNPGNGVSASAGTHVNGRAAQEALAVLRAREEYARRFGVSIRASQTLSTTVANDHASTTGTQLAQEDTNQDGVKAKVKAKWLDPGSDVLWVWVVPSQE